MVRANDDGIDRSSERKKVKSDAQARPTLGVYWLDELCRLCAGLCGEEEGHEKSRGREKRERRRQSEGVFFLLLLLREREKWKENRKKNSLRKFRRRKFRRPTICSQIEFNLSLFPRCSLCPASSRHGPAPRRRPRVPRRQTLRRKRRRRRRHRKRKRKRRRRRAR